MRARFATSLVALALLAVATASATTLTWNYDLTTTGQNVNYTTPTAVDPTAPRYHTVSTIDLAEVRVRYSIFNLGPFNITNQIPPEFQSSDALLLGPCPITVFSNTVTVNDPATGQVAFSGLVNAAINAQGFGTFSITNVTLGNYTIDLGPPFGTQTVRITSVRVRGTVHITPIWTGDLDQDGDVDLIDLANLLSNFGLASGATEAQGDVDADGAVNLTDLAFLLINFGRL